MTRSNQKPGATLPLGSGCFVLLLGALVAGPVEAGVRLAPGGAIIFASSQSIAGSITDLNTASAPGYGDWNATVQSVANDTQNGIYASAQTTLITSFSPDNFAVSANGIGNASNGGTAAGGALVAVFFFVDTVQTFFANSYQINGSYTPRLTAFVANMNQGQTTVLPLVAGPGFWSSSGRLPPGAYMFYVQNSFGPESESGDCTTFGTGAGFISVTNPLINRQPGNMTVQIHQVASFSVGTSGNAPARAGGADAGAATVMTYQWRKGLQNLSDGGRISGVNTSELTIADAAVSDSGLYDCVVTLGPDVEPSSLVHLTVNDGTTDVPMTAASSGLEMAVPSPSPFGERTEVRFSLPRAESTSLDVLDVNGRRVRSLIPRGILEAGSHAVTWDGHDTSGARSPAGVYFLRLVSGAEQTVRRVVSLGGSR